MTDRDAAEAVRLEAIIIAYDRLQATAAEAIAKAEREAEGHKTDAEFWKHNADERWRLLTETMAAIERLGSSETFTIPFAVSAGSSAAAELIERIEYARATITRLKREMLKSVPSVDLTQDRGASTS